MKGETEQSIPPSCSVSLAEVCACAALENGEIAADVQSLAMEIAEKLANDDSLQKQTNLRRSITIRSKIRRLWQLMVVESRETREHTPTDDQDLSRATHIAVLHGQSSSPRDRDADGEVTRAGYRMLHMRIAKILIPVGAVNLDGSSQACGSPPPLRCPPQCVRGRAAYSSGRSPTERSSRSRPRWRAK